MRWSLLAALLVLVLAALDAVGTVRHLDAVPVAARAWNLGLLAIELCLLAFASLLLLGLRRGRLPDPGSMPAGRVDVLVPVRNESPEVLRGTLRAAGRMRAPPGGFRVTVVDDSDQGHREGLHAVAQEAGARWLGRSLRRGYKGGALNDALGVSDAPFVAILDVDHEPEPGFLVDCLPHLDGDVAYAQGILEWRNATGPLRRLASILQTQFHRGVQAEKGARERAVFAGSGAVFRRDALDAVGGFPEETLVEDYDLTMRLCAAGWKGRSTGRVAARGLLPWTARDLARQLWRWSHGTTEAVALRARDLLGSRRAPLLVRLELLADGSAYVAGGLISLAVVVLCAMSLLSIPLVRPLGTWAILLAPIGLFFAHVASAAQALAATGRRDWAWLPAYHLVSLAFTPVLFVSSLAALVRVGRRHEGRVAKARERAGGMRTALWVTLLFGLGALSIALWGSLPLPAAAWVGVFGVGFLTCGLAAEGHSVA